MLVTFKIRNATTKPGESAYIVGNTEEFGNWIVSIFNSKPPDPVVQDSKYSIIFSYLLFF